MEPSGSHMCAWPGVGGLGWWLGEVWPVQYMWTWLETHLFLTQRLTIQLPFAPKIEVKIHVQDVSLTSFHVPVS